MKIAIKKFLLVGVMTSVLLVAVGCSNNNNNTGESQDTANNEEEQMENTNGDNTANNENGETNGESSPEAIAVAQCLSENNVTMYGTDWCGHCQDQKAMFGDAFSYIEYVNCEDNRQDCVDAGVRGYPTWINAQGETHPGTQDLNELAEIGNCSFEG